MFTSALFYDADSTMLNWVTCQTDFHDCKDDFMNNGHANDGIIVILHDCSVLKIIATDTKHFEILKFKINSLNFIFENCASHLVDTIQETGKIGIDLHSRMFSCLQVVIRILLRKACSKVDYILDRNMAFFVYLMII